MAVDEFLERLVTNEIAGKNAAIHAYDKMIWTIRTGFLTLMFAGWGLLLSSFASDLATTGTPWSLVKAMLAVSIGLAFGGLVVDINYVRRKFRVISSLNGLMQAALDLGEGKIKKNESAAQKLRPFLVVSGDAGTKDYTYMSGYRDARTVSLIIYAVPLVAVSIAIMLLE